jgi:hypothetical protein
MPALVNPTAEVGAVVLTLAASAIGLKRASGTVDPFVTWDPVQGDVTIAAPVGTTGGGGTRRIAFPGDVTMAGHTVGRGGGAIATNLAVGGNALLANTTGAFNTAVGLNAMEANLTGNSNAAFGYQALAFNLSGVSNTAIGVQALGVATGDNNVALGWHAGIAVTTGFYNTLLGTAAGWGITTGTNNVAVGGGALQSVTTTSENVAIGKFALMVATGRANVALGYLAGVALTTGNYNVVIGGNDGASIAAASNQIILADGEGNIRAQWNAAALSLPGTVAVAGDFAVATTKFTVVAATGNTAVGGSLGVAGILTVTNADIINNNSSQASIWFNKTGASANQVYWFNDGTTYGLRDVTHSRNPFAITIATQAAALGGSLSVAGSVGVNGNAAVGKQVSGGTLAGVTAGLVAIGLFSS